jgi:hypothetical protein
MNGLECNCKSKTFSLKVNADFSADPVWCNFCKCNLEFEELSISSELREELSDWAAEYGNWINFEEDSLVENAIEIEKNHNKKGEVLAQKLKFELSKEYTVSFEPSNLVQSYLNMKNE